MTISIRASDHFVSGPGTIALRKLTPQPRYNSIKKAYATTPKAEKCSVKLDQNRNGRKIMKS
jgi:hypothetical protein